MAKIDQFYTYILQFSIPNWHIEHIRAHQWDLAQNHLHVVLVWIKVQNSSGLFRFGRGRARKFGKKRWKNKMLAVGFEPTTYWLVDRRPRPLLYPFSLNMVTHYGDKTKIFNCFPSAQFNVSAQCARCLVIRCYQQFKIMKTFWSR